VIFCKEQNKTCKGENVVYNFSIVSRKLKLYTIFSPLKVLFCSLQNITELTPQLNPWHHQPISLQKYLANFIVREGGGVYRALVGETGGKETAGETQA
jgi:hypothetical protein